MEEYTEATAEEADFFTTHYHLRGINRITRTLCCIVTENIPDQFPSSQRDFFLSDSLQFCQWYPYEIMNEKGPIKLGENQ